MMDSLWRRWREALQYRILQRKVLHPKASDALPDAVPLSVSLETLLSLRHGATEQWLLQLEQASRPEAQGTLSPLLGRGLEFKEHRLYQSGDDPRHLDWKVTARRGQAYTRLYHQERQRPWVLLVDQSSAMQFGQQGNKLVQAARLAAQMGWAILAQQDQLALWIETDQQGYWQARHTQARHWVHTLAFIAQHQQQLGSLQPRAADQWEQLLPQLAARLPRAAQVVLISDFQGFDAWDQLDKLAGQARLWLIHLTDPLDADLVQEGAWIRSGHQDLPLSPALREAWKQAFIDRQQALQKMVQGRGLYLERPTKSETQKPLMQDFMR
ncbi:DUF58 domain-containing protein [Marinospirillum sp.]|uniref:DUF58 domain-containing protein n=1 Tax=Marinospirillum sp. TaxID=2183934 RepID=UPI003A88C342